MPRHHAIIEQINADLKASALAHLPSGKYAANAAWLVLAVIAHNLTRAAAVIADPAIGRFAHLPLVVGEGANGPLLLTGSIITSTDPLGLMDDLADEVRAIPGVADVPLATPNQGADTGIIQVIPEEGPQAESTAQLVSELRSHHDEWVDRYGVSLAVTGFTAGGIDVSQLLFEAPALAAAGQE